MTDLHFWGECKKTLEKDLTVEEYSTWIAPLMLEENNGSNPLSYSVLAPNKFISDWVEDNYGSTIKERLSAITSNRDLNLQFEIYVDYQDDSQENDKKTKEILQKSVAIPIWLKKKIKDYDMIAKLINNI